MSLLCIKYVRAISFWSQFPPNSWNGYYHLILVSKVFIIFVRYSWIVRSPTILAAGALPEINFTSDWFKIHSTQVALLGNTAAFYSLSYGMEHGQRSHKAVRWIWKRCIVRSAAHWFFYIHKYVFLKLLIYSAESGELQTIASYDFYMFTKEIGNQTYLFEFLLYFCREI